VGVGCAWREVQAAPLRGREALALAAFTNLVQSCAISPADLRHQFGRRAADLLRVRAGVVVGVGDRVRG